ncbi:hypothetical protein BJ165DRAFT_1593058 [Panaeolus papilionaceus]|nr:hypothetical protein BJ165DRAFT_1593058 [Panaeolus papilionaceus]
MAVQYLAELPTDILLSTVVALPWSDIILRVRRISRLFHDLTRSKALWVSLIMHPRNIGLLSSRFVRPLDTYTSAELEEIFLCWKRTSLLWPRPDYSLDDLRTRIITPTSSIQRCNQLILLPGGRWLLMSTIDASVLYIDLASKQPRHTTLIPPQVSSGHRRTTNLQRSRISVNVRPEAGTPPSFTFAHAVLLKDSEIPDDQELTISVWEVRCTLDQSQEKFILSGTRLFEIEPQDAPSECYIESMVATTTGVVYTLGNVTTDTGKETYIAERNASDLPILPNILPNPPFHRYQNRDWQPVLSTIGDTHAVIIDTPLGSPSASNTLTIASLGRIFSAGISVLHFVMNDEKLPDLWELSPPFRIYNTTRWIGITPSCTIVGIIIPDDIIRPGHSCDSRTRNLSSQPNPIPTVLTLRTSNSDDSPPTDDVMVSFGYHHISLSNLNHVTIITFSWPDDDDILRRGSKTFSFPTFAVDAVIDEISGTMVRTNGKNIYVSQTR